MQLSAQIDFYPDTEIIGRKLFWLVYAMYIVFVN